MRTLIMKFGGSSVDTTSALTQLLSIVLHERENWDALVLVASALEGVTDALIEAAHLAQLDNRRGYRRIVATIRTRHVAMAEHLPLGQIERNALLADIDRLLFDMLDICQALSTTPTDIVAPDKVDAIIGVGERLTARIIAALLRQNDLRGVAIDGMDLIITDAVFGNATPNLALTEERITHNLLPMLERQIIPVVTGFIGATSDDKPTTLGRGGSDYTASILAACIKADEVWIWTSVDGMMTGDPREIPDARVIPELAYPEVAEMAYFGARILHARMIGPLRKHQIPLRIKNIFKPSLPGTRIDNRETEKGFPLKAVSSVQGIGLSAAQSGPLFTVLQLIDETLFTVIGVHADVMFTSQSSSHTFIGFVIPTNAGPDAQNTAQKALEQALKTTEAPQALTWTVQPVTIITTIGSHLNTTPEITTQLLRVLNQVKILAYTPGPTGCNLSLVVNAEDGEFVLHQIHQLIINQ